MASSHLLLSCVQVHNINIVHKLETCENVFCYENLASEFADNLYILGQAVYLCYGLSLYNSYVKS